jgi:hypothetical protein
MILIEEIEDSRMMIRCLLQYVPEVLHSWNTPHKSVSMYGCKEALQVNIPPNSRLRTSWSLIHIRVSRSSIVRLVELIIIFNGFINREYHQHKYNIFIIHVYDCNFYLKLSCKKSYVIGNNFCMSVLDWSYRHMMYDIWCFCMTYIIHHLPREQFFLICSLELGLKSHIGNRPGYHKLKCSCCTGLP